MNKRGAIEMSMTTVVVIVLAMTLLILGLTLVRTIFKGATESVNLLNDKVKGEITNLFAEEGGNIVVKLGAEKTAKVPIGTTNFGIGIGARNPEGEAITSRNILNYKIYLPTETVAKDCKTINQLSDSTARNIFLIQFNTLTQFDEISGPSAFSIVRFSIPSTWKVCSQKFLFDVYRGSELVGASFFIVEVVKSGIF